MNLHAETPPNPVVAEQRLVALLVAQRLRQLAAFHSFMARVLAPLRSDT